MSDKKKLPNKKAKVGNELILLKKLEKHKDGEALLYYLTANEYLVGKEYGQAQACYQQVTKMCNKDWPHYPTAVVKMIICLDKLGSNQEVINLTDKFFQQGLKLPDLIYLQGKAYYKTGKYLRALKRLEHCVEMIEQGYRPQHIKECEYHDIYYLLGKIYEKIRENTLAFKFYERALLTRPNSSKPAFKIAKLLLKNQNIEYVKKQLEKYFNLNSINSLAVLSQIFYEEKHYNISLIYIEKAMRIAGRLDYLLYLQAQCLFFLSHFKLTQVILRKIPPHSSHYYSAQDLLCWCYWQEGKWSNVRPVLQILKKSSSHKEIYEIYDRLNRIFMIEKIVSPLPLIPDVNCQEWSKHILWILERLLALKNYSQFEIALKLLDLNCDQSIWGDLGKICYYHGLEEKAKEYLLRYLKNQNRDPLACGILEELYSSEAKNNNPVTNNELLVNKDDSYLNYYSLAQLHCKLGEYDEALVHYEQALTLNPHFTEPLYKIASIVLSIMKENKAKEQLESYFDLSSPISLAFLGDIYCEEKRYDLALGYLQRAKESDPRSERFAYYFGICLYKLGRYHEALLILKSIEDNNDYYRPALDCICYCLWAQHQHQEVEDFLFLLEKNSQDLCQVEIYKSFNSWLLKKDLKRLRYVKGSILEREKWILYLIEKILELGNREKEEQLWHWLTINKEKVNNFKIAEIYYKLGKYENSQEHLAKVLQEENYQAEVFALLRKIHVLN